MPIPYRVVRTKRKTVSLEITPEADVLVRCPISMRDTDIHALVQSRAHWIETHLEKRKSETPLPALTPGELAALKTQARDVITRRVQYFAPKLGVGYARITIRCQRTRWGSCSSRGSLSFNCLLMLTPPQVLDYVVVHELCHRIHMNHSVAFWAEVERIMPDYKVHRNWLKAHGRLLSCAEKASGQKDTASNNFHFNSTY